MPTYQYRCPSCGHSFEEFQPMTDDPLSICPVCGERTRRIISGGSGFLFKGSGFYATDYRSKQYRKEAAEDKPPSPAASSDSTSSGGSSPSSNASASGDASSGNSSNPSE